MTLHVLDLESVPAQPWRNGGGVTRELLAWPNARAWALRVSVADIEHDGPFSVFPGVDRWFGVLTGRGVVLRFGMGERWRVMPDQAPLQFDGESAPHCELIEGGTRDLNVMILREHGRGSCELVRSGDARVSQPSLRAVFAGDPTRLSRDGEPDVDLPPMTLAWAEPTASQAWRSATQGRAWWIEFTTRSGG